MKLCILIDTLNKGGAERSAGLLSNILSDLGHQVFIITLIDDIAYPYSGELINLGLYKKGSRSGLNKFLRYLKLKTTLKEHQFDLILDFRMKDFPIREFLLNKLVFKTKMVNMVRSYLLDGYFPKPISLSKYLYKNYNGINSVSLDIQSEIEKTYGFRNVFTIQNPVDIDFINKESSEELHLEDEFIIALGRLHPIKQIDKLIIAYNKSILRKKNIKLFIVGQGSEKNSLNKKIKELDLEKLVEILPFQENPFKYLAKAKFLVLSSKNEGFPRVLMEALASGTPVVSFNCKSGPSEIIDHRKNGLLVESQNFEALTHSMNVLIEDKKLYQLCRSNAKSSISKFSISEISQKWQAYLEVTK